MGNKFRKIFLIVFLILFIYFFNVSLISSRFERSNSRHILSGYFISIRIFETFRILHSYHFPLHRYRRNILPNDKIGVICLSSNIQNQKKQRKTRKIFVFLHFLFSSFFYSQTVILLPWEQIPYTVYFLYLTTTSILCLQIFLRHRFSAKYFD